ncbi:citrate/2-methylcitrate synthase [Acetivibrio clariflavus]|uniref:Citrate synthase n=1 Tax=Acetivibrio clariflavus (strain DSM 19732 / NBRC 101661 / EBR45) TaxID=720554 RepID=G8M1Q4_ACECE|nr:citrate synthase [Acetivibrio clariflavus DSM 19732]
MLMTCEGIYSYYSEIIKRNNHIQNEMFEKYNVKRGLRNADDTGVLVGLTEVGDVHAYIMDEGEKIPVEGKLRYRGIDIYDIVEGFISENRLGFEETCYLLLFGELPNKQQLDEFSQLLGSKRTLPDYFAEDMILKAPSKDIMNKLARAVLASYSYDENPDDTSIENTLRQCIELIARFPTMVAYGYQAKRHYHDRQSLFLHSPRPELSTAENILHLIRPDSTYTRSEVEILDLLLVLHAEHGGGNNSTFATRVVSSSGTDTYSAIAAAIGSLKGPKHGGANIKVMQMMENIKANVKNWSDEGEVSDYLVKILKKEANDGSGLIYGIGHAVYTLSDPRAVLLKRKAEELAKETGNEEEYNLFTTIERLAPEVFAKVKKSDKVVSANVDFYSGFVYKSLGIPVELYTPLFAIARIAGWSAHLLEEHINGGRIIRPAYKNVKGKIPYKPLKDR